ncbi:hypothetical protein BB14905_16350 [Bacillus sp. B14905]|nr:hypothetical protein BB14905_16350 [Bacillus sp. B14905]
MNTWNQRFLESEYVYGEQPNAFIKDYVSFLKESPNIAAYAEGEGRNAVFLASKGHTVTAYDYAQSGLAKTEELAQKQHVSVQTRLTDLLLDELPVEKYDAAIMVFGHFPLQQQQAVIQKIIDSVKQGGRIMMDIFYLSARLCVWWSTAA